jgi:Na+-driven multidrug efflux pump
VRRSLKELLVRRLRLRDTWAICFVLGFIMMNYPFLSIFNKPTLPFGVPLLYLYLVIGWVISIFIVYLFSRATAKDRDSGENH